MKRGGQISTRATHHPATNQPLLPLATLCRYPLSPSSPSTALRSRQLQITRHRRLPLAPSSTPTTAPRRTRMAAATAAAETPTTLLEYMGQAGAADDLVVLVAHVQSACKRIAALVASPGNAELSRGKAGGGVAVAAGRDAPKPLDELSVRAVSGLRGLLLSAFWFSHLSTCISSFFI